jgi:acyl-CoA synthetase (AMP-forming)/AMP-acid ligase II
VANASAGMVLGDLAHRGELLWGRRIAFAWEGRTRTYAELADRTARLAGLLARAGVEAGTRVATLSPNQPEVVELCFAASLLGAVVVPLNTRLVANDLRFQTDDAGVTHALVHPALSELAGACGLGDVHTWMVGAELDSAVANAAARPWDAPRPSDDAACIHLYTSGTTGNPKGCLLSQRGWLAANANLAHSFGVAPDDRLLGVYPFFHVAGFGIVLAHLTMGARVVVPASAEAEEIWRLVDEHALTTISMPGLKNALKHPMADKVDRSTVRRVFGGAAMESAKTLDLVEEVLPGARFAGVYGSTEAGNFVTVSGADDERSRPGTIGRPLLGFDIAILGEGDVPLAAGEEGELGLRGPSTMIGYWNLPDATAETLRAGWLHTGDIMRLDEDGFLYFVDRSKDMIKPGGENVYSIEIETVLLRHPDVVDCAVIGVPDARWGEAVKALVVLETGASATPESLDAHCLANLAPYKRPRWYEITDAIPRSATGKIVKRDLRAAHDPDRAVRLAERT